MVPVVTLYTRTDCHLCETAKGVLASVQSLQPFELTIVDVDHDRVLVERYGGQVPVVLINGRKVFKYRVDPVAFRAQLERAARSEPPASLPGQQLDLDREEP